MKVGFLLSPSRSFFVKPECCEKNKLLFISFQWFCSEHVVSEAEFMFVGMKSPRT